VDRLTGRPMSVRRGSLARAAAGVAAGILLASAVGAAPPAGPAPREVARCIRDPRCHTTYMVAHRAKGLGAPENSRAAIAKAIEAGIPVVKIDVRASRDGELFVLHDGTLQRTTSLRGRIETLPSAQLASAALENGEMLPRFTELYEVARGRIVLTLGFKAEPEAVERVADWIRAHGSFDDVIFFVNTGEAMAAAASAKKRYSEMIVMVRLLDTRVTVESTRAMFGRLPEIFHTERVGADEVSALHRQGVKVYMDATAVEGRVPPLNYFAIRSILASGADLIQTDDPLTMRRRIAGR